MTVRLALDPVSLTVDAGGRVTCTATVRNTSSIVERYTIVVLGAPAAWTDVDPPAISLLPDAERTVTLTFHPPRGPVPNAATLAFAVKIIPTKQAEDTAVEEGDITVNPFIELVPSLRPRSSRGATVGHHVLRLTNRGNSPVDASLSASDPDELLKSKLKPTQVRVLPGGTAAARIDMRPRNVRFVGPPTPRPFQVQVQPVNAPLAAVDGSYVQRPILPRWLPRAAVGLAVVAIGTALYASRAAKVTNVAKVAADTTVPTTVKPAPPASAPGGGPTTVPGGGSAAGGGSAGGGGAGSGSATTVAPGAGTATLAGGEPGVQAQGVSCDPYDPSTITVQSSAAQPPPGSTTTAPAPPVYNVVTNDAKVAFQFTNPTDANVADSILSQYKQVCYVGRPAPLSTEMMVLEPFSQNAPNFPQIPGAQEKCNPYNSAPGTLVARPPDAAHPISWLADLSTNPVTPFDVQDIDNNADAQTALQVARVHKQRCWVGGGSTWTSLDHPPGSVLEYWR